MSGWRMEKVYAPCPDPSRHLSGTCMQSSSGNLIDLPLPPGLVGDLLDRRQEILQDGPRAEVDLGVNLHAGDEAQLPALALEVVAAQAD